MSASNGLLSTCGIYWILCHSGSRSLIVCFTLLSVSFSVRLYQAGGETSERCKHLEQLRRVKDSILISRIPQNSLQDFTHFLGGSLTKFGLALFENFTWKNMEEYIVSGLFQPITFCNIMQVEKGYDWS